MFYATRVMLNSGSNTSGAPPAVALGTLRKERSRVQIHATLDPQPSENGEVSIANVMCKTPPGMTQVLST